MTRTFALVAVTALFAVPSGMALAGAPGHAHEFGAGEPGDPSKPARLVPVTMKETDDGRMVFVPANLDAFSHPRHAGSIGRAAPEHHEP